jgi:ubiquinone/menaquinone biosynthesis C-methylase UbiE
MSTDETDYTDEFAAGLELMWGHGFMSPGGTEEVGLIVQGLDLRGKEVLDIGAGLGGPSICLVSQHGAGRVVGIDLEPLNVERATRYAARAGVSDILTFQAVDGGSLPFEDGSFDAVFSKDAITEAPNKEDIFLEAYRVLRSGGWIAMSDWFRDAVPFTPEMKSWMKQVGLVLEMTTLDKTAELLRKIGFADVVIEDRNAWYQDYSQREVARMAGEDRHLFERVLGEEGTADWIEGTKTKTCVVAQLRAQMRPS